MYSGKFGRMFLLESLLMYMETSDFGDFGKNRQRAGDNGAKSGPLKLDYKRCPYNCEATLLKERSNYILNKRPL